MHEQPARPTPKLSNMGDAGQAAVLLLGARSSEIDKEMGQLSHAAILNMVLVNVLQLANGALALRAAVTHFREVLAYTMERVDKYKKLSITLFGKLTWQQEEAKVREEDLGGRIKEAECQAEIEGGRASAAETQLALVSARLEAAGKRIEELTRQLQHSEGRVEAATNEVRAVMQRATATERVMVDASHERAGAVAHAHEASARTEEAENRAWEAEARAREAEARIREAEARAREAEARANNAVANFKASAEFEQEVVEASHDAYAKGFDLCKAKVSAAFNFDSSKLEEIQPGDLGDEEPAEEEEAGEEPGPSEP